MKEALLSLSNIFNNKEYLIIISDDGSSDDSYEVYKNFKIEYNIKNLFFEFTRPKASKVPQAPSHGQISGLERTLKNHIKTGKELVYLLDCDDYYLFDIERLKHEVKYYDVIFLEVINEYHSKNLRKKLEIKRFITDEIAYMWPTIVPTSGLVIKASFLENYFDMLLTRDAVFDDIWLDLRINICALHRGVKISYSDKSVVRRLHGENDSSAGGLLRFFSRQIAALRYRKNFKSLPPCKKNIRYMLTNTLLKFSIQITKYTKKLTR